MFLLGGGKLGQMLAALVTLHVMTSLMGPVMVATVSQFNSLGSLVYGLLAYPVITFFMRHQQEWRNEGVLAGNLRYFLRYILAIAALSAIALALVQQLFHIVSGVSPLTCALVTGLLATTLSLQSMGTNGLNVFSRSGGYVLFNNLGVWSVPLIGGLLFTLVSPQPLYWMFGLILGQGLCSISLVVLGRMARQPHGHGGSGLHVRTMLHFASAQSVSFALWWMQSQSYRFTLGAMGLAKIVGLVASAQMITNQLMQAFTSVMGDFFMPMIMSREGATREGLSKFVNALLPATLFFGATLIGIGPLLVRLFLGSRFHGVASFIAINAAMDTMWGIYAILCYVSTARVDMRATVQTTLIGGLLTLVLAPLLSSVLPPLLGTLLGLGFGYATLGGFSMLKMVRTLDLSFGRILAAGSFGLPIIASGIAISYRVPGTLISMLLLSLVGLYFFAVQYLLARLWLKASQSATF